jgi:hypothetical protein
MSIEEVDTALTKFWDSLEGLDQPVAVVPLTLLPTSIGTCSRTQL